MTTKPTKQTTQANDDATKGATVVMSATTLQGIVDKAIKADQAFEKATKQHRSIYTACSAALREGIESNVVSDILLKEYDRRRTEYVRKVIEARFVDYPGADKKEAMERARLAMMQGIKTDNSKAEWSSPRSETVKNEQKAKAEAERARVNREINKKVEAAKKKNPKVDERAVRAAVKSEIMAVSKEEREAQRENARFVAGEARFMAQLTALLTQMPEVFQADVREAQLRGAALLAELKSLQTKPL